MPDPVEKLTPHDDGRRRRMYMKRLSAVAILPDVRGANPEANVTFFKSAEKQRRPGESRAAYLRRKRREDASKQAFTAAEKAGGDIVDLVTSVDEGHQHGISLYMYDDDLHLVTSYAGQDRESNHDHQLVRNEDGSYSVLENFGHKHDDISAEAIRDLLVDRVLEKHGQEAVDKITEETPLADLFKMVITGEETVKEEHPMTEQEKQEFEALKAENATLKAVLRMTPAQKAHYDTLDEADQEAFAKMGSTARDAAVKTAEDANPEVYKAMDGTVYRQSDDPKTVALAKQVDDQAKDLAKANARNNDTDLTKRAEDTLANLPGEIKVHKAMLKALDGIEDEETRKSAHEALVAGDNAIKMAATMTKGTSATPVIVAGQDVAKAAEDELDKLAEDIQKADPKLSKLQALEKAYEQRPDLLEKAVG